MHAEFAMLPVLAAVVAHAVISSVVYAGDSSVRKSSLSFITNKPIIFR